MFVEVVTLDEAVSEAALFCRQQGVLLQAEEAGLGALLHGGGGFLHVVQVLELGGDNSHVVHGHFTFFLLL